MARLEYSLERKTNTDWIEEGVYFDDKEKAYEELEFYKTLYPQETFRLKVYTTKGVDYDRKQSQ